jgi:hypothetical protein
VVIAIIGPHRMRATISNPDAQFRTLLIERFRSYTARSLCLRGRSSGRPDPITVVR